MKKHTRKLTLDRNTVRALTTSAAVVGGMQHNSKIYCPPEPATRVMDGCSPTGTPPCATNWTCLNICQEC